MLRIVLPVLALVILAFIGLAGATEGGPLKELLTAFDFTPSNDRDSGPSFTPGQGGQGGQMRTAKARPSGGSPALNVDGALFQDMFTVPDDLSALGVPGGSRGDGGGQYPSGYAGSGPQRRLGAAFTPPQGSWQGSDFPGFSAGAGGGDTGGAGASGSGRGYRASGALPSFASPAGGSDDADAPGLSGQTPLVLAEYEADPGYLPGTDPEIPGSQNPGGPADPTDPTGPTGPTGPPPSLGMVDPEELLDPATPGGGQPQDGAAPVATPEPASMLLAGMGLAGIWAAKRRTGRRS